jgi:predicted  nucleic acid-binding Zn ribbon protein
MINVDTENSTVKEQVVIKRDFAPHRRVSHRICKTCGKGYILSDNDAIFFIKKFDTLPLKCEDCRLKNRTDDYVKDDSQ